MNRYICETNKNLTFSKRSEDTRILRERAPEVRKSDRAYFIFYLKIVYGFSLTFK